MLKEPPLFRSVRQNVQGSSSDGGLLLFFAVASSAGIIKAEPLLKRQPMAAFMIPSGRTGGSLSIIF